MFWVRFGVVGKCKMILIEEVIGCKVGSLPSTYLGLLLGEQFMSKVIGDPVLKRVKKWLAGWKKYYSSKGGKLTLIKSALLSLHTYFMVNLPLSLSIRKNLEKMMRDFLWNGNKAIKRVGRAGVKSLDHFNKVLLGKYLLWFPIGFGTGGDGERWSFGLEGRGPGLGRFVMEWG